MNLCYGYINERSVPYYFSVKKTYKLLLNKITTVCFILYCYANFFHFFSHQTYFFQSSSQCINFNRMALTSRANIKHPRIYLKGPSADI